MAVARPLALELCSSSFTTLPKTTASRLFSAAAARHAPGDKPNKPSWAPKKHQQQQQKKKKPSTYRFIPSEVVTWMQQDGTVKTNKENRSFFLDHGIELDNGLATPLTSSDASFEKLRRSMKVSVAYSPRHIITPYHIQYFGPFGHPLADHMKEKYAQKLQEEPLWMFATVSASAPAVVRTTAQYRLKWAVYSALKEMGYVTRLSEPSPPTGDDAVTAAVRDAGKMKMITGTLWLRINDPVSAVNGPAVDFGKGVAQALARRFHQEARQTDRAR
jgi:hypothetical protein